MEPDELLIKSVFKGNQDAFRKLVEKYQTFVFAICMNIVRDRQEAENLSQETFIQVYRSLARYESKGFKTWIGRIATNKAIDWKRKAENSHSIVHLDDPEVLSTQHEDSLQDQVIKNERKKQIISLCNQLPEKYSIVLNKYYIQSKSYQEISVEEGISIKTVESRLYRAKKEIRKKWEEEEQYEAF